MTRRIALFVAALAALAGTWIPVPAAHAAPLAAKVNFGPAGAAVPSGYVADSGGAFDAGRGFGWVAQNSSDPLSLVGNGRERNQVSDQRLDTLMHMQYTGTSNGVATPGRWEYALPAGTYDVTVAVGDPGYTNSVHRLAVEGTLAVNNFAPSSANLFKTATVRVAVADGRLTLDAAGGTNTKILYVDIAAVSSDPPPPPPPSSGLPGVEVSSPEDQLLLGSRLVFSTVNEEARPAKLLTVRNVGTTSLIVTGISISGPQASLFPLSAGQATSFTLAPSASATISVEFRPPTQNLVENYATLTIATDRGSYPVSLAGLDARDYEHGVEPSLAQITRVLGYKTTIGSLGRTRLPSGDERISPYWRAVDTTKAVQLIPLAVFSGRKTYETGITGWYPKGTTTKNKLFGIPGGSDVSGGQNQRLFPVTGGTTTFRPGGLFGLYADTDWSDDARNGSAKIHDIRFFPAKGPGGTQITNAWLVAHDIGSDINSTSKNYDYNDGVWLLVNATPELIPAVLPGTTATRLDFSAARAGTVADRDGEGTGFTGVQPNTAGNQYQPSLIDLDTTAGVLKLTSTSGVASKTANTQQNALEVAYDGSRRSVNINTRLVGPFSGMDAMYDLQALSFGPDQDNYAKLEVEHRGDGVYVTLWLEQGAAGVLPVDPVKLPAAASISTVDLSLTADPATGGVSAAYRVNSDDPAAITAFGPAVFPTDVMRWFSVQARAGVLVANQNNPTPFTGTYTKFNVD
jgi:hypothetical protein